jgi:hypothetical protein
MAEAQSVSFVPNGSLTGVTSSGSSTTFTVPVLLPDGSAAAPALSFSADPDLGIWRTGSNALAFSLGSATRIKFLDGALRLGSAQSLTWSSNVDPNAAAEDTLLIRDAANTLALRNSTAAQTFNIYNTYTDASNYERGIYKWASNALYMGTEVAGTGTPRPVVIQAQGASYTIDGTRIYGKRFMSPASSKDQSLKH